MQYLVKGAPYVVNPAIHVEASIKLRLRSRPFRQFTVSQGRLSRASEALLRACLVADDQRRFAREVAAHGAFLAEVGVLVPAAAQVSRAPVPTEQHLEPSVLQLIPERLRTRFARRSLRFNRQNVVIQRGSRRPVVDRGALAPDDLFPFGSRIVWVFDEATRIWGFFHCSGPMLARIEALEQGRLTVDALTSDEVELFTEARVLTTPRFLREQRALWRQRTAQASAVAALGLGRATRVLSPLQVALLRRHVRQLREQGHFRSARQRSLGDFDVVGEYYHRQSSELVNAMTGEAQFPSWSLYSSYEPGAALPKHKDIPQCAWNVSLPIDQDPEGSPWPLFVVDGRGRVNRNELELGDIALYRGVDQLHWRPRLPKSRRETVLLWFYVPLHFKGLMRPQHPEA